MATNTVFAVTRALVNTEADTMGPPSGSGYGGTPFGKWTITFRTPNTGVYIGGQDMPAGNAFGSTILGYELVANEEFTITLSPDPDGPSNPPAIFMTTTNSSGATISYIVTVVV